MLVLGLETATQSVGVAIGGPEGIIASFRSTRERRHAEALTPAIEFVCLQAQVDIGDVDVITVDMGPGSFTGLRVGLATAKALAYARHIPMVGICSLDLVAHPAAMMTQRIILSVIDARRGEVYYAMYQQVSGEVRRLIEPRVGPLSDVVEQLRMVGEDCLMVGDGAQRYAHLLQESGVMTVAGHGFRFPNAESLVEIGAAKAMRGELVPESEIQPLYLRPPDAKPSVP